MKLALILELQVMLKAKESSASDAHKVRQSTRFIAFLGTPFCGSKQANFANVVKC